MSNSAGKIVKDLLTKHGPLTTNAIAAHLPKHPELVSKSHLKHRILAPLQSQGVLIKKIHRDPASLPGLLEAEKKKKEVWVWQFPEEAE